MPILVSRSTKKLIVPPEPGALSMFPDAPRLPGGNEIVLPHGIGETLMLRHLGFKVPSPLMHYDWHGGTPFAVQQATVEKMVENPRFYVLNGMGTGKTKSALWAWDFLYSNGHAKKLLVVAPLSILKFTWASEVFATIPHRRCSVLYGTKKQRQEFLAEEADIYIINHDGLKVIFDDLQARTDINTLVIDELAVYRNNSDRSTRMRKFAQRFDIVWGLTGAPMPNEPTDVWGQCKILTPDRVPRNRSHCRDMLMTRISNFVWKPKPDAVERAFQMMQPSVRYALDDVVELPPLVSRTIDVEMSAQQKTVYKRVATTMRTMIGEKAITALNAGAAMNKLLQIAGGWVYTIRPEVARVDPAPRMVAMCDLIHSAERKVIVAVPYRHMIEGISNIFSMKGVDIEHAVVHGGTTHRETIFNEFQNTTKYKVLLVHPQCVSHGLTLTAADTMIWYLPITSLDIYDQLNARFRRIGQKHKQQLFHIQATPIEKKIYRMLAEHQRMQETFLQLVEEATSDATISVVDRKV